jgi:pimeloyl-ACP methyl ester carboxylesterase
MTPSSNRSSEQRDVSIRGLRHRVHTWSGPQPPLVLLHGWGDTGLTYQFIVEHLAQPRLCVAPDWRGFGDSDWSQQGYWFPDYLADLDAFLEELSPTAPVDLVAHSMGGNVAMLYAGVRPHRVRRLINLEGFGLSSTQSTDAPTRYREWLDQWRTPPLPFAQHESWERFEWFLSKRNPRTRKDRIAFIARAWARERADGRIVLKADPRHRYVNPVLYRRDEALACWGKIEAPVLLVRGDRSWLMNEEHAAEFDNLRRTLRNACVETLEGVGHMLHHEAPEKIAQLIERFLAE